MNLLRSRLVVVRLAFSLTLFALTLAMALPAEAGAHSLTGPLPASADAPEFVISPDSRWVAYVTDADTDGVDELYVVPITGTTPTKLNPPLVAGGSVKPFDFMFTPDSQAVLYLADQDEDNVVNLYNVPVHGGLVTRLNGSLVAGGNVIDYRVDAATERVVYAADQQSNDVIELWTAGLYGGDPIVKLSGPMTAGGDVGLFAIDAHTHRVIYSADQDTNGTYELYSVAISGFGGVTKLNPAIQLQGGGDSGIYSEWQIDQPDDKVVFIAREASAHGGNLYAVASGGGGLTKLNFNLLATQRLLSFKVSPAGQYVVFNVGNSDGVHNAFKGNLYAQKVTLGGAANISETAGPLYGTDTYQFVPDGSAVVYTFQNYMTTTLRLEAANMVGVRAPLYTNGTPGAEVYNFQLSPDSHWVAFQTGPDYLQHSLYTVPPTGGTVTGIAVGELQLVTPNSGRLLYLRTVDSDAHNDLFSQQIFSGSERNLTHSYPAGYIGGAQASSDGHWFVYPFQLDGHYELRASDGASQPPPLFMPLVQR